MRQVTIKISGSAKEVLEIQSKLWNLIQDKFKDYTKHRIFRDNSVIINLEPKKGEAWLKSRSYHE